MALVPTKDINLQKLLHCFKRLSNFPKHLVTFCFSRWLLTKSLFVGDCFHLVLLTQSRTVYDWLKTNDSALFFVMKKQQMLRGFGQKLKLQFHWGSILCLFWSYNGIFIVSLPYLQSYPVSTLRAPYTLNEFVEHPESQTNMLPLVASKKAKWPIT